MLYTPLLPGAAGGTLEPRHVVVPLREQLDRTVLHLGTVTGADPGPQGRPRALDRRPRRGAALRPADRRRSARPRGRSRSPGWPSTPSASRRCPRRSRCATGCSSPSSRPRSRPTRRSRRELLTFVFVGAGYAGLEGLAELQDFAADVVDRYPRCRIAGMRFMLVEARDRVMPEIQPKLAAFASAELRRRGIEIRTETTVERDHRDLRRRSPPARSSRAARWSGPRASSRIRSSRGSASRSTPAGGSTTDRYCAVAGRPGVWAIGDAAAVPDPAAKGKPSPPTAQHVLRQAKVAADNVVHALAGQARPAAARSATGRSACSSTWAATRRSRARSASAGAASRPGSSPAPTTSR